MKEEKQKKSKRKKVTINGQEYYPLHVKVRPYLDKNGNRQEYKTFYGKTLKECRDKADKFNAGNSIKAREMFFGELVEDYIKNTFLPSSKIKERSKQRYVDAYNNNLAKHKVARRLITDIEYRCLQEAYNEMTCGPSTVESIHKLLQHFFALMEQEGICKDPTKSLVVPKAEKKNVSGEIVVFTDEEIASVKSYLNRTDVSGFEMRRIKKLRFLILLAINTGARIGELLALTYDDIYPDKIVINKQVIAKPIFKDGKTDSYELSIEETKTENSVRSVPITEETYNELEQHRKWHQEEMLKKGYRTNQVFTTSTGRLQDPRSLRHTLDRLHEDAGVPQYGFHVYRHTFGTKLAANGVALQTLASLMGHSDISVTAKYYINIPAAEKVEAIKTLSA